MSWLPITLFVLLVLGGFVIVAVVCIRCSGLYQLLAFPLFPLLLIGLMCHNAASEISGATHILLAAAFGVGILLVLCLTVVPLLAQQRGGSR